MVHALVESYTYNIIYICIAGEGFCNFLVVDVAQRSL